MSRAIKLKNNDYLDSMGVSYKRDTLKRVLDNIHDNPIGELILWSGNKLISNNNDFQWIGTRYGTYENIIETYPLKSGYTRKYKLKLDYTDNKPGTGGVYVVLRNNNDTFSRDFIFPTTWGSVDDGFRRSALLDFPNDLFTNQLSSWIKIYGTPDFANGGSIRYYSLSILIYDIKE